MAEQDGAAQQRDQQSGIEQETAETDAPDSSTHENEQWWRGADGHSEVH